MVRLTKPRKHFEASQRMVELATACIVNWYRFIVFAGW